MGRKKILPDWGYFKKMCSLIFISSIQIGTKSLPDQFRYYIMKAKESAISDVSHHAKHE